MGSTQSVQQVEESEEEEEEEEEDEEEDQHERRHNVEANRIREALDNNLVKKVLEQEPEMLPCHASASPLSPQLSSLGTPRLGPSIKVWDPYNVLAPPPPLPPPPPGVFSRSFSSNAIDDDRTVVEVFLINHGECELNLRPDFVSERCPEATLMVARKRQARVKGKLVEERRNRYREKREGTRG